MLDLKVSSSEFRSDIHEQRPHVFRNVLEHLPDAGTDLAQALSAPMHHDGRVNVFLDGVMPFDLFTENAQDVNEVRRLISLPRIESLLARGATVAINRIDRNIPFVRALCDDVQAFSQEVATANCYAALHGKGSFGSHWDTHDVFALQTHGMKQWRVWQPSRYLPTSGQGSGGQTRPQEAELVIDTCLEAGDALYIPRGWWHDAAPIPGFSTVHLAIGLHVSTVVDYVAWLATTKLAELSDLRRCFSHATSKPEDLAHVGDILCSAFKSQLSLQEYQEAHANLVACRGTRFVESLF